MLENLSVREVIVLRFLAKGFSNKQIAERLLVHPSQIKQDILSILYKLNVKNRLQAVIFVTPEFPNSRQLDFHID